MATPQQPIIQLKNISKRFDKGRAGAQTLLEVLVSTVSKRPKSPHTAASQDLWAVRDLSVDIMRGDSLGFIGRNGSGKSTALKLIAGILQPTSGTITVNGRISALLELGAGFHPDLTGRENIYLNGAVLGLSRKDIEREFDNIVAFSELVEFIDMPVKHYSSGMYMRLGFSVAIHVSPDVLIVDEILAVGDQAFQRKCLEHIYDLRRRGTTIIMVSHDANAMRNLCTHLVWMEQGVVKAVGESEDVLSQYMVYLQEHENTRLKIEASTRTLSDEFVRWGTGEIEITRVRLLDGDGREQEVFRTGSAFTVEVSYTAHERIKDPEFGLAIYRQDGVHVNAPNHRIAGMPIAEVEGDGVVTYHIPALPLLSGKYMLTVACHNIHTLQAFDMHKQAYTFRVVSRPNDDGQGLVTLPAEWEWQPADVTHTPVDDELPIHSGA